MDFMTYGTPDSPPVMLIHGMATTAEICYHEIAQKLKERYYVILAVIDGHNENDDSDFISLQDSCEKIEKYVTENFGGRLYGISGFSLGGSISVMLLQRGMIKAEKVHLDAAFCVKLGLLSPVYTALFVRGIGWMQSGRQLPDIITEHVFGKGNNSVKEMLYTGVSNNTIINCCHDVYRFELTERLRGCTAEVTYWLGENEQYPRKTAALLRKYLPEMQVRMFAGMGHGQLIHEHKAYYCRELMRFLEKK